jgi:hypothetical protein
LYPGQPNNNSPGEHYAAMAKSGSNGLNINWRWVDQPNASTQHRPGFVCEWDSAPQGSLLAGTPAPPRSQSAMSTAVPKAGQIWEGSYDHGQTTPFRMKLTKVGAGQFEGELYLLQFNVEGHGATITGSFGSNDDFEARFTQRIRGTWLDSSLNGGRIQGKFSEGKVTGNWTISGAKTNGRFEGKLVEGTASKSVGRSEKAPDLNERTFAQWRDYIAPKSAETAWLEIPWKSTFWEAVVEAQREDKPILVWAMNGDPLGCT